MNTCADIYTNEDRDKRLHKAIDRIVSLQHRERHGIGTQKEKTLHAVLKNYEDPNEDHQEIPIGNFIADIYRDDTITEIQTADLGRLRGKLNAFLPEYEVTVVYPIPAQKWITWVDPQTGEPGKRNRSPKRGTFYSAFRELYKISPWLDDPHLKIKLILLDIEEYRLQDGWGRDGKRGSHRHDRMPVRIEDELILTQPRDYLQFVPYDIEEPFTSPELAQSCGFMKKSDKQKFSTVALILHRMGVIERVGKRGRAFLYRVPDVMK